MQKKQRVIGQEVDSTFAYSLLRNDLLPDLLGQEEETILYWAGKHLAKKYPLSSIDEICDFFQKAGWGTLSVVKEKPNTVVFELIPPDPPPNHYKLEAGFLAEQFAFMRERVTETFEQMKRKSVIFTVESMSN